MPRTPEETRKLFDRWAETYDAGMGSGKPSVLWGCRASLSATAGLIEVAPGERLLDATLRQAGFSGLRWAQVGPFHWAVSAVKP